MKLQKLAKDFLNLLDKISEQEFESGVYTRELTDLPNGWFASQDRLTLIIEYAINKVRFNMVARELGWASISSYKVKNFYIKDGKIFAIIIDTMGVQHG